MEGLLREAEEERVTIVDTGGDKTVMEVLLGVREGLSRFMFRR